MKNYARIKLRPSTFKTSQGFLKDHIKPQNGSILLAEFTSPDLQSVYFGNTPALCGSRGIINGAVAKFIFAAASFLRSEHSISGPK